MTHAYLIAAATLFATQAGAADVASQVDPHQGQRATATMEFSTWDGKREQARFSSPDAQAPLRSYVQSTTVQLRDPGPQHAAYDEHPGQPRVRSGSLAFDALFALAMDDMRKDSVTQIRDGSYNGGAAIACDCFETGEKWHYVWTRDLSYAADLGLALFDPVRVMHSLDFKLSGYRRQVPKAALVPGSVDGLQIIQDTGSGGSWPVSTDRVSWAFGAEHALRTLPQEARRSFAPRALAALSNTIEIDRVAAFDAATGLYTGEQSFLDWREQSYAAWIVGDLAAMASSKALSTNVAHYQALQLAAMLAAEQGDAAKQTRYSSWAAQLKRAINRHFWLDDAGMYSSLSSGHFDGAPLHKFDWLGQALAIVTGVADDARARSILAHYPHGPMGAPVIYPQQPGQPVYHNRAMWPFVSAYGLKAAAKMRNVAVADAAYASLMRGAALNLSNMENLEWLSGQALLVDETHPALNGPVINSKRQLWSVGAYLGMVVEQVFGVRATGDGVQVAPFITARLRREAFAGSGEIVLHELSVHGKRITVRIALPPVAQGEGYYPVQRIRVNGAEAGASIRLERDSIIDIELGALQAGEQAITRVAADPYVEDPAVFGPREPAIEALERSGRAVRVTIAAAPGTAPTLYTVYRDGKQVARGVPAGVWTDRTPGAYPCYAVEARLRGSGNHSHHSAPRCIHGGSEIAVNDARVKSNVEAKVNIADCRFAAVARLQDWGAPTDTFTVDGVRIAQAGRYQIQLRYHNSANQINLGISGGVKWLTVKDARGRSVASGVVQLPHAQLEKVNTPLVYSTPLTVKLGRGSYRLELSDFYNMSYLESNSSFSGTGGVGGPSNRVDLFGVRVLRTNAQ